MDTLTIKLQTEDSETRDTTFLGETVQVVVVNRLTDCVFCVSY